MARHGKFWCILLAITLLIATFPFSPKLTSAATSVSNASISSLGTDNLPCHRSFQKSASDKEAKACCCDDAFACFAKCFGIYALDNRFYRDEVLLVQHSFSLPETITEFTVSPLLEPPSV